MKKRALSLLLCTAMTIGTLSGCGKEAGNDEGKTTEELEKNGSPRAESFTDEDRRAMRIRIQIHLAFLEADDQVSLSDSYEKAAKKVIVS